MPTREIEKQATELEPLAEGLANIFIQRSDLYARQVSDGSYICIPRPLQPGHVLAHLRGDLTLGTYALDSANCTRFLVFDADDDPRMVQLVKMAARLANEGAPAYLETSRRGGHLWLFFPEPVPGKTAREFARGLRIHFGIEEVETFPKQDRLKNGPGSLIRLPFGIHRRSGRRYGFVTPDLKPLAPRLSEQIRLLSAPRTVTLEFMDVFHASQEPRISPALAPLPAKLDTCGASPSERIKNSISVRDFISRYVELSPAGLGLCPFHDDHHPSLAVNESGNYWHCFAGCGGGSIIDFWMKWQRCDFSTAVRELSRMLLN